MKQPKGKKIKPEITYRLEQWQLASKRDRSTCRICKNPSEDYHGQVGFRILDTKENIEKYGHNLIYSYHNMICVCCKACGRKVVITNKKVISDLALIMAFFLIRKNIEVSPLLQRRIKNIDKVSNEKAD